MRRLLRETNVVIIFVLGLCKWVIDIARPRHSLEPVAGYARSIRFCICGRHKSEKSDVCDGCYDYICIA